MRFWWELELSTERARVLRQEEKARDVAVGVDRDIVTVGANDRSRRSVGVNVGVTVGFKVANVQ
jgi:hypothetical protein